jgi:AraC-like DNA-binding protein
MIVKTKASFSGRKEEYLPMDTVSFPYLCMSADLDDFPEKTISWHWHKAFEINYIASGQIDFMMTGRTAKLSKGDVVFINSDVLHALSAHGNETSAISFAHFIDSRFLSGGAGNILESEFVFPLTGNTDFNYFCLYGENQNDSEMIEIIKKMTEVCREEPYGYEFMVRNLISSFWIKMFERYKSDICRPCNKKSLDGSRIRDMMQFVRENFNDKLGLKDIAGAAGIGTRECNRCFDRTIGMSPMEYLNQFRLEQAIGLMLNSDESITNISEDCGFFSNSYFSKCFHDRFGCTPNEYRKRQN